jgi:hypothetical protein
MSIDLAIVAAGLLAFAGGLIVGYALRSYVSRRRRRRSRYRPNTLGMTLAPPTDTSRPREYEGVPLVPEPDGADTRHTSSEVHRNSG